MTSRRRGVKRKGCASGELEGWSAAHVDAWLSARPELAPAARALRKRRIGGRALSRLSTRHFVRMGIPASLHLTLLAAIQAMSEEPAPALSAASAAIDPQGSSNGVNGSSGSSGTNGTNETEDSSAPAAVAAARRVRVAIVGTAGRNGPPASLQLFEAMQERARHLIATEVSVSSSCVHLVSGGAALSDHVAVHLFRAPEQDFAGLTLYLPCAWSASRRAHHDSGASDWKRNPGRSANRYHRAFSKRTGLESLREIDELRGQPGVELDTSGKGFHDRNSKIASAADLLIAFTWSTSAEPPKRGGTRDTWNKARLRGVRCVHVSLHELSGQRD